MPPIDAATLRKKGKPVITRKRGHMQEQVIEFLEGNATTAYTQKEIAEALTTKDREVRPQQVNQICKSLMKQGVAERRSVEVDGRNLVHWIYVSPET